MMQKIQAIFENGVLRPLEPLKLSDHQEVSLTVHSGDSLDWLDEEAVQWATEQGDASISLHDVRVRLSSISESMAQVVISERGEY